MIATPRFGAKPAAPMGIGLVTISTATSPSGPRNVAARIEFESPAVFTGCQCGFQPSWPASQAASQIAIRAGRAGSGDRASMCTDSIRLRLSKLQGGSKNWAINSRQRARPNQALSRLHGQRVGSSPSRSALGFGSWVGQIEDQPRALVGQIAKELRVLPRVAGPPEHHRQIGLEQRPDGAGNQVDRRGSGPEHDPLGAHLGHSGRRQVAKCRHLGMDVPLRVVRTAYDDRPARKSRDHRLEHRPQRLTLARPGTRLPGWPGRYA